MWGLTDGSEGLGVVLEEGAGPAGLGSGRAAALLRTVCRLKAELCQSRWRGSLQGISLPSCAFLPYSRRGWLGTCPLSLHLTPAPRILYSFCSVYLLLNC